MGDRQRHGTRRLGRLAALTIALAVVAAACGNDDDDSGVVATTTPAEEPTSTPTPAATVPPGDRGQAFVNSTEVEVRDAEVVLVVAGDLPTPCHEAAWEVAQPEGDGTIEVEVFSIEPDPDVVCAAVLEPFAADIPLGSLEPGSYTVVVNGEPVDVEI